MHIKTMNKELLKDTVHGLPSGTNMLLKHCAVLLQCTCITDRQKDGVPNSCNSSQAYTMYARLKMKPIPDCQA